MLAGYVRRSEWDNTARAPDFPRVRDALGPVMRPGESRTDHTNAAAPDKGESSRTTWRPYFQGVSAHPRHPQRNPFKLPDPAE